MRIQLTEKNKALLSAYHDGELSGIDRAEIEHLLEHSAEARAWLHGARSVGKLSVTAAHEVETLATSSKLTGAAIVSMAKQQGVGGGFLNAIRSPWSVAGAVGTLVVGTLLLTNPFSRGGETPLVEPIMAPVLIDEPVQPVAFVPDNDAVVVPPISSRDLVGFALEGTLPINQERTSFIGLAETEACDAKTVKEVDAQLRSLGRRQLLALDSLSELLRTAILRKDDRSYVVRYDLSKIRWSVITQIDEPVLSATARKHLLKARHECEQTEQKVASRLVTEMNRMQSELMTESQQPYFLINTEGVSEEATGDQKQLFVLERFGSQPATIVLNPTGVNVFEKNPKLVAFVESRGTTTTTVVSQKKSVIPPTEALKAKAQPSDNGNNSRFESEPESFFMANVIITLTSDHGHILISNDVDTTINSLINLAEEPEAFYNLGSALSELTDRFNVVVGRIAVDTTRSVQERAEQIYYLQNQHEQNIKQLLEQVQEQKSFDSTKDPEAEDGNQLMDVDSNETSEEAAQMIPTCDPPEIGAGVS